MLHSHSKKESNECSEQIKDEEIVKLSPELYGIGINLKTLWRRIKKHLRK